MKSKITSILFAILLPLIASAATPNDVLAKASTKISSAKSITAKFTGTTTGTLTVSGHKFSMVTPGFGVWYNGKDMWAYSKQAGETSLTVPTAAELMESNPMEIIKNYRTMFNTSKVSDANGKYTIKLTPKNKNNVVKSATIEINTANYLPTKIDILFNNSQRMTVNITKITEGASLANSVFEYPAANYPGIEVVDLR